MNNQESLLELTEFLKIIIRNLLNKRDGFKIAVKRTEVDGRTVVFFNVYCDSTKDPGILLGSKQHNPRMKDCILKLLYQKAYYFDIHKIDLTIGDSRILEAVATKEEASDA